MNTLVTVFLAAHHLPHWILFCVFFPLLAHSLKPGFAERVLQTLSRGHTYPEVVRMIALTICSSSTHQVRMILVSFLMSEDLKPKILSIRIYPVIKL